MLSEQQTKLLSGPPSPVGHELNDLLCRVGPNTPMGNTLRRYWVPALLARELPEPDCPPVQVRLLGEDLVAFRDTQGRVGVLQWWCPHRGTPLWMGRNEDSGLRCIYHGWKFDVLGNCVDQMNEPEQHQFKSKIQAQSYPTLELGDVIWTYMGPKDKQPSPPAFEWTQVPSSHREMSKVVQECNWLQALEGGIDPSHARILHGALVTGASPMRGIPPDRPQMMTKPGRMYMEYTDYGHRFWRVSPMIGEYEGKTFAMGHHFVMPWTQIRIPVANPYRLPGHFYVPRDDESCVIWNWDYSTNNEALTEEERYHFGADTGNGPAHVDQATFRSIPDATNDWFLDRETQRTESFSGFDGINVQDRAVQEGVGPIIDRSRENLGQADLPLTGARRLLMDAVKTVDDGGDPPGTGASYYNLRGYRKILEPGEGWHESTFPEMDRQ
jgi:phthalate 4,5-dioxygenase oxygenase subunit